MNCVIHDDAVVGDVRVVVVVVVDDAVVVVVVGVMIEWFIISIAKIFPCYKGRRRTRELFYIKSL